MFELGGSNPALAEGDFLRASDLQALALFNRGDELPGFEQAVVGAGVQPGVAAAEGLHLQLALLQIDAVDVGDLQLAARRGLEVGGDVAHLRVVEVQAGDGVAALRLGRLFFDADGAAGGVELDHAVAFGVVHVIGVDRRALGLGVSLFERGLQIVAPEQVVAEYQRAWGMADEVAADDKSLRQAVGAGLHRVPQAQAPLAAVAEQLGKTRGVLRGGDDEHLADACEHERGQRVVDHRLVVHRQQLLAHRLGDGVEPGAGAAGEDEAFAGLGHSGSHSGSSSIRRCT